MALFQKRPDAGQSIQYYSLSQHKTILVVGLGNVGKTYDGTRHNIGFACVDRFAKDNDFPTWAEKRDLKCHLTSQTLGDAKVYLIKPTTLMNLSGEAVQAAAHFYKISPDHIVAVHDELDIPFGQIRTRVGGSAAGHNGIKSVTEHIGENYGRVRIGIGPKTGSPRTPGSRGEKVPEQIDSADFVLAPFSKDQQAHLKNLTREVSAILTEHIYSNQLPHETRSFIV